MSVWRGVEWRTLALIIANYAVWGAVVFAAPLGLAVPALAVIIAFQSSLTHEVVHGHPFACRRMNAWLMRLPLELFVPFDRFVTTHLAHHRDSRLTDPYDDPESNYWDGADWDTAQPWIRRVMWANNTLAGRIVLGPVLGQARFMRADWQLIKRGDGDVLRGWLRHGAGVCVTLVLIVLSPLPLWAYLTSTYLGGGLIRIRTFLEHRAHEESMARTAIVESRGPLAFLFLFNSLHAVHHRYPQTPWYALPALYRAQRDTFVRDTDHYVYSCYGDVFRRYLWRRKDPVAHPLWRREKLSR